MASDKPSIQLRLNTHAAATTFAREQLRSELDAATPNGWGASANPGASENEHLQRIAEQLQVAQKSQGARNLLNEGGFLINANFGCWNSKCSIQSDGYRSARI